MTTYTAQIETFLASDSNMFSRELMQAVIEQLGGEEEFLESYNDIINHGMAGGFSGFIYYTETVDFFNDNFEMINQGLVDYAECIGQNSVIALLTSNEAMKKDLDISDDEIAEAYYAPKVGAGESSCERVQLCNWISWSMATDTAVAYSNYLYELEQEA